MIRSIFLALLLVFAGNASASIYWVAYSSVQAGDPLAACKVGYSDKPNVSVSYIDDSHYKCLYKGVDGGGRATRSGSCDAGTTFNKVTGVCDAPPPIVCTAGAASEITVLGGTSTASKSVSDAGFPTSIGGCAVTVSKVVECHGDVRTGVAQPFYCTYGLEQTGALAPAGSVDAVAADVPAGAQKIPGVKPPFNPSNGTGTCPAGTVNTGTDLSGMSMCSGSGTSPIVPPKTTVQAPAATVSNGDGSSTTTTSSAVGNADGSTTTTTTKVTTGADGTKSTTVSQSTSPGAAGGVGVADADKTNDLCAKHPELNICKNSTVSGDCESTSCTGDAITCAMLRQQKKEYCENKVDNAQSLLGKQILAGSDPQGSAIAAAFAGTPVDLSSQSLDQSGFLGGGACIGNKSISVAGRTIAVNFSPICDDIQPLRYAVLAASLLAAYLLVSKSILQG